MRACMSWLDDLHNIHDRSSKATCGARLDDRVSLSIHTILVTILMMGLLLDLNQTSATTESISSNYATQTPTPCKPNSFSIPYVKLFFGRISTISNGAFCSSTTCPGFVASV
jgi:hypothetical protein